MADLIVDPVTRINGDAGVRVVLDEAGNPQEAQLKAFGYRGFEQITRGAHLENLLSIVSRICGCDSVFHQIAAATAVERACGAEPPQEAIRLRELAMWGQTFERHAVSLTVHSLPDLLFPSSDPGLRNIISIHRVDEEVVRRVMTLKSLGTSVLRAAGGRAVHPVNFLPGGAVFDIPEGERRVLTDMLEEAKPLLMETGQLMKLLLRRNEETVRALGTTSTAYLSLLGEEGMVLMGAALGAVGSGGESLGPLAPEEAADRLSEGNSPHAHIRSAELSGVGEARVGPLARLNVNRRYGTPLADAELEVVKSQWGFPLHQSILSHLARILEMIHAWERMVELLSMPAGEKMRREVPVSEGRGVGVVEAPEGTLLYDLVVDEGGLIGQAAIVAPLQFNLKALEGTLLETARAVLAGADTAGRASTLLETAVRAYAPCIPCGIH